MDNIAFKYTYKNSQMGSAGFIVVPTTSSTMSGGMGAGNNLLTDGLAIPAGLQMNVNMKETPLSFVDKMYGGSIVENKLYNHFFRNIFNSSSNKKTRKNSLNLQQKHTRKHKRQIK